MNFFKNRNAAADEAAAYDQKRADEAAAYKLKMSPKCTVCGHEAGEHYAYSPWTNIYGRMDLALKTGNGCLARIWVARESHGKAYEASEQCDCPLTPDEVLHNQATA